VSEVFSVQPWGAYALPYILSAWVATRCGRRGWGDDPAPRFLVILTAVTVALGARALLLWALGASFLSPGIDTALVMVVYNGILGAVIFSLLEPIRAQLVAPPRRRRLQ
jgi:hypothetical protein